MDIKEEIYNLLKNNGDRLTKQKKNILSVLIANTDRMISVSDILNSLPNEDNMDNATVYRNVSRLTDLGILETIMDEKGTSRYVINCTKMHHHHLICVSCGKVLQIPCKNNYWDQFAKDNNFEEIYHKLEIYGKCEECKKLN